MTLSDIGRRIANALKAGWGALAGKVSLTVHVNLSEAQITDLEQSLHRHLLAVEIALERMELKMALDSLNAVVATASAAADRLIEKSAGDSTALADAKQQIANLEADAVAAIQPLADKLTQAAPEPAVGGGIPTV